MLADINPGIAAGLADNLTSSSKLKAAGSFLYFGADDGQNGYELWRTSGSEATTAMVMDLCPGPDPSMVTRYGGDKFDFNGQLAFIASETLGHSALYITAGSAEDTHRLTPLSLNGIRNAAVFQDELVFEASDAAHGAELWRSNGTPAGLTFIGELLPGPQSLLIRSVLQIGNILYVWALGDLNGLWSVGPSNFDISMRFNLSDLSTLDSRPRGFVTSQGTTYFTSSNSRTFFSGVYAYSCASGVRFLADYPHTHQGSLMEVPGGVVFSSKIGGSDVVESELPAHSD